MRARSLLFFCALLFLPSIDIYLRTGIHKEEEKARASGGREKGKSSPRPLFVYGVTGLIELSSWGGRAKSTKSEII